MLSTTIHFCLASPLVHSEPIFNGLKIFNFDKLYMLETAKAMFDVNQNLDKFPVEHEFVKTNNLHKHTTRQSSSEGFSLHTVFTNLKRNFLTYNGIIFWNSLPRELKKEKDKNVFLRNMKIFLQTIRKEFHSIFV